MLKPVSLVRSSQSEVTSPKRPAPQYLFYEALVQGKGDYSIVDLGQRALVTTCGYHHKLLSACFICHRNGSCARWKRTAPQQLPGLDIVRFQVSIEGC